MKEGRSPDTPTWTGYFINLDRSTDRRAAIEAQLEAAGLSDAYQRIAAVDGSSVKAPIGLSKGEWGCLQSHLAVLKQPPTGGFVHVLEDDAILSRGFTRKMASLLKNKLSGYDLVFTDVGPTDWPFSTVRKLKHEWDSLSGDAIRLIDLKGFPYGGTDSYFINPRSIGKVREFVEQEISSFISSPIDVIYLRGINSGRLKAALTFPFLTAVNIEFGTRSEMGGLRTAPVDVLRYAFFVDCDDGVLRQHIDARLSKITQDAHRDALADIYKLYLAGPEPSSRR